MEYLIHAIQIFLHIDKYLSSFFEMYGWIAYAVLFFIIFAETGLVIIPFLPGDSLLFAAGALAAVTSLQFGIVLVIIPLAAILGNSLNYALGYWVGPHVFTRDSGLFFNKAYLNKAHSFYEKFGPIAITICRFFPIIRTFTPFVAGIAKMNFWVFTFYNVLGGIVWSFLFLFIGYFLGNIPIIKANFSLIVVGIILASLIPFIYSILKHSSQK